ncbi:CrcB family protein [Aeromicrobium sp.]|uniref:fluoride efflux transporter FluC n=1 Tax=Aeromicrobium sp. TaxID=1871063 RepID=UPI0028AA6661|nr:CrcB family protein [Aeromicrobium sp.]
MIGLVALAGGIGAGLRFVVDALVGARVRGRVPLGTFVVNVTGSLVLGLLVGLAPGDDVLTILGVGLLGGYTTFSAASLEAVAIGSDSRPAALAHGAAMLAVSLAAAGLGLWAGGGLVG